MSNMDTKLMNLRFGKEGINTLSPPKGFAHELKRIDAADGKKMLSKDNMYREKDETHPGRRERSFSGLHNLHDDVMKRTVNPEHVLDNDNTVQGHRAYVWDRAAEATRDALAQLPAGAHINICANSGPKDPVFEAKSPGDLVKGANFGLLYVAEFHDDIHPLWIQIACPIREDEGRLLAGLRVLPMVIGRADLTFHISNLTNFNVTSDWFWAVRNHNLNYGAVCEAYRPTNLGCMYFKGLCFSDDACKIRDSFAWDGDVYGWDEAIIYTRKPVVIVTNNPGWKRFQHWMPETVLKDITWYRIKDAKNTDGHTRGKLVGGKRDITTRAMLIEWDKAWETSGEREWPGPSTEET